MTLTSNVVSKKQKKKGYKVRKKNPRSGWKTTFGVLTINFPEFLKAESTTNEINLVVEFYYDLEFCFRRTEKTRIKSKNNIHAG
jgi:hypothetical protein